MIRSSIRESFKKLCEDADSDLYWNSSSYRRWILRISAKLKESKALTPDEVPNNAFILALKNIPETFIKLMQVCFEEGTFTRMEETNNCAAGRPICLRLLDSLGKMLEIIRNRMLSVTERENGLPKWQFVFRIARSTLDAIFLIVSICRESIARLRWKSGTKKYSLVVTLDLKNAFKCANWEHVMKAL